jgi:hypothetical protein
MKTREVIHITCEVIILSVISFYFHKKIKKLAENVDELKRENEELRSELHQLTKVLSSMMLLPAGAFSVPPGVNKGERGTEGIVQKNAQREHLVFHPLSPIEEEDEEDKCRLGISELQEEGKNILEGSNEDKEDTVQKTDTATIIFSTISPQPRRESTAKLEVIENTPPSIPSIPNTPTIIAQNNSKASESTQTVSKDVKVSSSNIVPISLEHLQDSSSNSSSSSEALPISNPLPLATPDNSSNISVPQKVSIPSSTENEKLKVIDPKTLRSLRKKKNGV